MNRTVKSFIDGIEEEEDEEASEEEALEGCIPHSLARVGIILFFIRVMNIVTAI
jgi:hypothetical protein